MIGENGALSYSENEAKVKREETKHFKEKFLKCKRCGSRAVAHRAKTDMIRCLVCGHEWDAPKEGEI